MIRGYVTVCLLLTAVALIVMATEKIKDKQKMKEFLEELVFI